MNNTRHYQEDRAKRQEFIDEYGEGDVLYSFLVDRNHPNGKEWHHITDTGLIVVTNERTGNHVTTLIARPGQLSRYEKGWYGQVEKMLDCMGNEVNSVKLPQWLYKIAMENQRNGNNMR